MVSEIFVIESAPPLTVTLPPPNAVALLARSSPAFTVTEAMELPPVSTKVPVPDLARVPLPEMEPELVRLKEPRLKVPVTPVEIT